MKRPSAALLRAVIDDLKVSGFAAGLAGAGAAAPQRSPQWLPLQQVQLRSWSQGRQQRVQQAAGATGATRAACAPAPTGLPNTAS